MTRIDSLVLPNPNREIVEDRRKKQSYGIKDIKTVLNRMKLIIFWQEYMRGIDKPVVYWDYPRYTIFWYSVSYFQFLCHPHSSSCGSHTGLIHPIFWRIWLLGGFSWSSLILTFGRPMWPLLCIGSFSGNNWWTSFCKEAPLTKWEHTMTLTKTKLSMNLNLTQLILRLSQHSPTRISSVESNRYNKTTT